MLGVILLIKAALADCVPVDLAFSSRRARVLLDEAEPVEALAIIVQAEAGLPCLDVLARRDDLAELFQIGGTAALKADNTTEAQRLFAAGARVAAQITFDISLGEPAAQLYAESRAFVDNAPKGSVLAWTPVRLDGLDIPTGIPQSVPQGGHLVQQVRADGSVQSSIELVAEGEMVEIGTAPAPPPTAPARERHLGRALGGAGLVLAGSTALVVSGVMKNGLSLYEEDGTEPLMTIDLLTFGGGGAVCLGTVVLLTRSFRSSMLPPQPLAGFSGQF